MNDRFAWLGCLVAACALALSGCAPVWQGHGALGPRARAGAAGARTQQAAGADTVALLRYRNQLSTLKKQDELQRARQRAAIAFRHTPDARQRLRLVLALTTPPADDADLAQAKRLLAQFLGSAKPWQGEGRFIPLALFLISQVRAELDATRQLQQARKAQVQLKHKLKALMQVEQKMNRIEKPDSTP